MIVYIAGPMSGLPQHNYPAFNRAEEKLAALGYTVLNPVHVDLLNDTGKPQAWDWYMRKTIAMLVEADAVALLEGWQKSTGARLEKHIALELNMPAMPMKYWLNKSRDYERVTT